MKVLITIKPLMYRESLALVFGRHRPDHEVMLAPAASLDKVVDFKPDMLIRNNTDGVDMELMENIRCWIEVLYSDDMDARVSLEGEVWNIKDMSTRDLLRIVDRTEKLTINNAPIN